VNAPKNKKNAPAAESGNKRRNRTADKLIRPALFGSIPRHGFLIKK